MEWLNEGPGLKSHRRAARDEAIDLCRDVYAGTLHMRKQGAKYLPAFAKEDPHQHADRIAAAVLHNVYKRTVRSLTGMVMRKAPQLSKQVPEEILEHLSDVDQAGRSLPTFSQDLFNESWIDGLAIIFVDMPPVAEGTPSDEARGLRPYWNVVRFVDVLDAKTERRGGRDVVTLVRWRESAVTADDADRFKEVEVHRVREYRLVSVRPDEGGEPEQRVEWEVWELKKVEGGKKLAWTSIETGTMGRQMDEIPLAVVHTQRASLLDAEPPLLDLAAENVRHYQKSSDKDNIEHVVACPIFTTTGVDKSEVEGFSVGPTVGVALPKADATAAYVETTGRGADINRQALIDSERRMAFLGASMLYRETRSEQPTATQTRVQKAESDSQLTTAAESLEKGLETAVRLNAKWLGKELPEDEKGLVTINRDFENLRLDAQTIQALAALVPAKLSTETFWAILVAGEVLPDTFDPEVERTRLENQDIEALAALKKLMGNGGPGGPGPADPAGGGDDA